jgi:hypothetical protein
MLAGQATGTIQSRQPVRRRTPQHAPAHLDHRHGLPNPLARTTTDANPLTSATEFDHDQTADARQFTDSFRDEKLRTSQ